MSNQQSRTQSLLTSYSACSTKRTGSKSPQIADLLYCVAFQRTNQDRLRIGPFQSPSFSSSMRCKKLEGSGYEIEQSAISERNVSLGLHGNSDGRAMFSCFKTCPLETAPVVTLLNYSQVVVIVWRAHICTCAGASFYKQWSQKWSQITSSNKTGRNKLFRKTCAPEYLTNECGIWNVPFTLLQKLNAIFNPQRSRSQFSQPDTKKIKEQSWENW